MLPLGSRVTTCAPNCAPVCSCVAYYCEPGAFCSASIPFAVDAMRFSVS